MRGRGQKARFKAFHGLWGWVLTHRQPLLTNEPDSDSRAGGLPAGHLPIRNFLAVPAIINDELVGEIAVANSNRPYTERDLRAVEQFALLYAIAIQRQRWVEELARSREEAVAANRSKDQFIANMSHELRTPLNGILGMTNILLGTELDLRQMKYLAMNKNAATALLRIINDILDYSKAAANRLKVEAISFDLRQLLAEIIEFFTLSAMDKGLTLDYQISDRIPSLLRGDPGRLRQILVNLLGNALKFTDTGGVTVAVRRQTTLPDGVETDPDRILLCIAVQDTGIGIAKNKMAALFKEFSQVDGSLNRRYGGTGLGLSFSKKLAELMGGHIWVESEEGKGSTFYCDLPFTIGAAADLPAESDSGPADSMPAKQAGMESAAQILLAEDDLINREVALAYLRQRNWHITSVPDGQAAVEAFRDNSFDLILMDVQMPGMNGLEATSRIRQLEAETDGGHTPIIALTAHTQHDYREKCIAAGMDDFLTKPLTPETLYSTMEHFLPGTPGAPCPDDRPPASAHAPHPPPPATKTIDLTVMRKALHGKEDLLRKLMDHLAATAPGQLEAIRRHLEAGEAEPVRTTAHTLKGTLANFGAEAATALAAELEKRGKEKIWPGRQQSAINLPQNWTRCCMPWQNQYRVGEC